MTMEQDWQWHAIWEYETAAPLAFLPTIILLSLFITAIK
jgi:hypothetical protein